MRESALGGCGLYWNHQVWDRDSKNSGPSTCPYPPRCSRQLQREAFLFFIFLVRDKIHLNPAAQAKKTLAKRRPALRHQYSCQVGSLDCGCMAGTAPPSRPGSLSKVRGYQCQKCLQQTMAVAKEVGYFK